MKRLFWFGLGMFAGARLNRRGRAALDALTADPIRELDRWIRVGTPIVRKLLATARPGIDR